MLTDALKIVLATCVAACCARPRPAPLSCPSGQVVCSDGCVTTSTDPANCGSCGNACAGLVCTNGFCCPTGQQSCGGLCRDLQTDSQNCGGCGRACTSTQSCTGGTCVTNGCAIGLTNCGAGLCADLARDPLNCGVCGRACAATESCTASACVTSGCGIGLTNCGGGVCADLTRDPLNCGLCGRACTSAQSCIGATCVTSGCGIGLTNCGGGVCADLTRDPLNCGFCGNVCSSGTCAGAACTTPLACLGAPTNASGAGSACMLSGDCDPATAQQCIPQGSETYAGEAYVTWSGGYCLPIFTGACGDATVVCPAGTFCDGPYAGSTGPLSYCWDQCLNRPTSWGTSNCDCRDGYECAFGFDACFPGCSNDRECCEIWDDANANFLRDAGEVTTAAGCTGTCNRTTFRCDYPGGAAVIGGACTHDSQCPALGRCLGTYPGGYCVTDACDLSGRGCPVLDQCRNVGSTTDPFYRCVDTCTVASALDPLMQDPACRAGYACQPQPSYAASIENGQCAPGNYTTVTSNALSTPGAVGSACADPDGTGPATADSQCYSPYGVGACADATSWATSYWPGGFCSIYSCDFAGLTAQCGTGRTCVAWGGGFSMCMTSCTPGGLPGTGGCRAGYACTPATSAYYFGVDVCLAACTSSAWCDANIAAGSLCNPTTGVCY